jgi:LuxR family maltose regulon positive regulatory protein
VIEILVLLAIVFQGQGDFQSSVLHLQHALGLAEPEGYVRIFLDEGTDMMQLLQEANARGILPDYTGRLLKEFQAEEKKIFNQPPIHDQEKQKQTLNLTEEFSPELQPFFEPLSQREKEILRLLKTELSGPEIAHELVIALSTVRTHTKSIYNKLNVNNRRGAVKRAIELKLI